jgi:hypothetical protein
MFIKDYLSLDPEDKIIISKRRIEDKRAPNEWITTLRNVARVDEQGDTVRKYSYRTGIIGIILCVIALISVFLEIPTVPILFIPGIILLLTGFLIYFIIKRFDLPHELIKETIIPILYLLREDIKKGEKIMLRMDLRGFKHSDKSEGEEEDHRHFRHKITNYFYKDKWFAGNTVLADGTELYWEIEDDVRHRVKKKYGSSGKSKGKEIKNKIKSNITVRAGVSKKNFALPVRFKQKGDEGKIYTQKQNGQQWITIERKIRHLEHERFIPKYFIDTVAEVYMRVKPLGENR